MSVTVNDMLDFRVRQSEISTYELISTYGCNAIYLENGLYNLTRPLQLSRQAAALLAQSPGGMHLLLRQIAGPALYVSPQSIQWPRPSDGAIKLRPYTSAEQDIFIEMSEYGSGCEINGATELHINCQLRFEPGVANVGGVLLASSSMEGSAFSILLAGPGDLVPYAIYFDVETENGHVSIHSAGGVCVPAEKVRQLSCRYDGTTARILLDGVEIASQPHTGKVVQRKSESVLFGRSHADLYGQGLYAQSPPSADVFSLSISDDRGITWTSDFVQDGTFMMAQVRSVQRTTDMIPAFIPVRCQMTPSTGKTGEWVTLSNLQVTSEHGVAIDVDATSHISIENVIATGKSGIRLTNTCFDSRISRANVVGAEDPRVGITAGTSCYYTQIDSVSVSGFADGIFAQTDFAITGACDLYSNTRHLYAYQAYTGNLNGTMRMSDEGARPAGDASLVFDGCCAISAGALSVLTGYSKAVPIVVKGQNRVFPKRKHVFTTPLFSCGADTPGVCHVEGEIGSVVLDGPVIGSNTPTFTPTSVGSPFAVVR